MIAIDVSRIVHLDAAGFERYPPTPYGELSLPSNMVTVQNEVQFRGTVNQRFVSFREQHRQTLGRDFVPRVAGVHALLQYPGCGAARYRSRLCRFLSANWFVRFGNSR